MKKVIILGLIIITTLSCKAQFIIPLEEVRKYMDADNGIPDVAYLKDVNLLLDKNM